jgi:hypothetical protein
VHASVIAILAATLALSGCLQPEWRSHEVTPELLAQDHDQETLRLTLRDSTLLWAHYPKLVADTLVWAGPKSGKHVSPRDSLVRHAIPISQLANVERYGMTPGQKKGTAVLGVAAVALMVIAVVELKREWSSLP